MIILMKHSNRKIKRQLRLFAQIPVSLQPKDNPFFIDNMKKYILDLTVTENVRLHANYALLKLTSPSLLPEMLPGQFAEIRVDGSPTTFLRRPISINYVDKQRNEVWFLIQLVGDGTKRLGAAKQGDIINVVLPLGNSFTMPEKPMDKLCLVGGGVGTAPMLY